MNSKNPNPIIDPIENQDTNTFYWQPTYMDHKDNDNFLQKVNTDEEKIIHAEGEFHHNYGRQQRSSSDRSSSAATGILWLIAGLVITIGTYSLAKENGGGCYLIAVGPIACGIIKIINGLFNS